MPSCRSPSLDHRASVSGRGSAAGRGRAAEHVELRGYQEQIDGRKSEVGGSISSCFCH